MASPQRSAADLPAAPGLSDRGGFAGPVDRTALGAVRGAGALAFSETQRVFWLAGEPCPLGLVRALDARGLVTWRFLEHRDWMRRLDEAACDAAYEEVLEQIAGSKTGAAALDEQIRRHVRKDDSYLHGRIVDADAQAEERAAAQQAGEAPADPQASPQGTDGGDPAPAPSAEAIAAAAALAAESGPGLSAPKAEHMTREDIRRHKRKQRAQRRAGEKAAREKRRQQDLANNEPKKPRSFRLILPKPKKGDRPADNGPIER